MNDRIALANLCKVDSPDNLGLHDHNANNERNHDAPSGGRHTYWRGYAVLR